VGGDTRAERAALLALFLGGAGIALAPIFVRWSEVGPFSTAFWRLALAAPAMWVWTARERTRRPASRRDVVRLVLPGLCFACDLGAWHWSIRFTTVANATLLANLAPLFVTLGGYLLFRRGFGRLFFAGMAVALAGMVLLVGRGGRVPAEGLRGDALGLLTAVFYASYILAISRVREDFSTATVLAWSASAAAVVLLPLCLLTGEALLPRTARCWLDLLGLAFVSHVLGQGLVAYALRHLPASFSSVTLLVQPIGAALLAWHFFGERMGPLQALGAAVIIGGILVARAGSRPRAGAERVPHPASSK
jgi:drug/metabolite transporter (DMT)-like permease